MELKLGSVLTIVVSSPEMAKQVLKVHDFICASHLETIASKIMFEQHDIAWAPYGDHLQHVRKLNTSELFSFKRLKDSKNVQDEELSWLVHGIFEHCEVNVLFHNFNFCFFSLHFKCCMNMIPKLERGSKLINITIEIVGCIALSLSFNPSFGTNIFKFGLDTRLIEFQMHSWSFKNLIRSLNNLQEGNPVNMQTSLFTSMNVISRLLFKKRYFNTMHTDEESEEFKDLATKIMVVSSTLVIMSLS
jgi:hypothetical protein